MARISARELSSKCRTARRRMSTRPAQTPVNPGELPAILDSLVEFGKRLPLFRQAAQARDSAGRILALRHCRGAGWPEDSCFSKLLVPVRQIVRLVQRLLFGGDSVPGSGGPSESQAPNLFDQSTGGASGGGFECHARPGAGTPHVPGERARWWHAGRRLGAPDLAESRRVRPDPAPVAPARVPTGRQPPCLVNWATRS